MKLSSLLFFLIAVMMALTSHSQVPPPPPPSGNNTNEKVFDKIEIEAAFPGGDAKWRDYLSKNVNSTIPQNKYAPPGIYTVVVQFIVDKEGNISNVTPLTNHGFGMEEEVVRVISKGPSWTAAIMNGKTVKAYRKQPVTFQVEREFKLSTYSLNAGQENSIEVLLEKVKDEDLEVTVTNGKIKLDAGKTFMIKPYKPGKLLLTVSKRVKKNMVELGKVMMEVK